jgi:beta-lactamase regulating signal transducer with metallopeptidase domain/Tol biopolymer transport system component
MSEFLEMIAHGAAFWGESIWRASLQGGIAIAAAWAISRSCRFLSARVTCWIWRLACLKLLAALVFTQPVNLPLLAAKPADMTLATAGPAPARVSRADVHESPAAPAPPLVRQADSNEPAISTSVFLVTVLCVLWATGVFAGVSRTVRQWRAIDRLRRRALPVQNTDWLRELREEAERLGIGRLPQLGLCPEGGNVQLVGIWRPMIILPESALETFDEEERRLILAHELAHLKRRDLLWNWLPTVTGWLFFFHPLVWVLVRRWCESQEAACDELVIQRHGARRAQYGHLLLKMSTRWPDAPRTALVAAGMSGAYRHLEHRILAMTRVKPDSTRQLAVSAAVASLIVLGGLIPWRIVAQEPARPRLPAAAPTAPLVAPNVPTTQLQNGSATTTGSLGSSSVDGTIGTSSSSGTASDEHMPGRIYGRAGMEVRNKTGATEKITSMIAIDPNTGSWEPLASDGYNMQLSPQKDRLAFCKFVNPPGKKYVLTDLYVANSRGGDSVKVAANANLPIWSPEGKRLLYSRIKTANDDRWQRGTWILDLGDKSAKTLPIAATEEVDDWSRDGEWFVTVSDRHPPFGSGYQLYVMHPDGTHERRITEGYGLNCYPRFRPGTNQIVYKHQGHGLDSLWLVDLDGSNRKQLLTSDKAGTGAPERSCWSPDGKWLAVHRFDWQTDVPGVANPKKQKMRIAGYCKDRIEIIAADGSSRGDLKLQGVTHVDWIEHFDWR